MKANRVNANGTGENLFHEAPSVRSVTSKFCPQLVLAKRLPTHEAAARFKATRREVW
jgi:hypothetical protein